MQLRRGKPIHTVVDRLGEACAYAIILGLLVSALAPLFAPLLGR